METQNKYDQLVYNLCQLLLKKKYKRVIYLAEHVESQGFSSHELTTIKTYAVSKTQGPVKALEQLQYQEGPLIALAKAQYQQEVKNWAEAQLNYQTLTVENQPSPINNFLISNQTIMRGENSHQQLIKSQKIVFRSEQKEEEVVSKINEITKLYYELKLKKALFSPEQYQQQCQALAKQYEQITKQHRPKKQLMLSILQYIRFLRHSQES